MEKRWEIWGWLRGRGKEKCERKVGEYGEKKRENSERG